MDITQQALMTDDVKIYPSTYEDALYLAANMREMDKMEVAATDGKDPLSVLEDTLGLPGEHLTAWHGDEIIAMFGCVDALNGVGVPWMLGTDNLPNHGKAIMTLAPQYVGKWSQQYETLHNFVAQKNSVAVRWLKRIGFEMHEVHNFGGLTFLRFSMVNNNV